MSKRQTMTRRGGAETAETLTALSTSPPATISIARTPELRECVGNTNPATSPPTLAIKAKDTLQVRFSGGFGNRSNLKTEADWMVEVDASVRAADSATGKPATHTRRRVCWRFATYANPEGGWSVLGLGDTDPVQTVYDFGHPDCSAVNLSVTADGAGNLTLQVNSPDKDVFVCLTVRARKMPATSGSDFAE